jgi:2-methylcitrate dehydratase PrpD
VEYAVDATYDNLPKDVVTRTKGILLDLIGTTLAGSAAPGCDVVVDLVKSFGGKEESTIIGYGGKVPSPMAALANGTMGHALDFNETHGLAVLHTSVSVIPAALALSEKEKITGSEFLNAVALGMDIQCRMGVAAEESPLTTGWTYTATMGTFGAAFAASKTLRLDKEQMLNAIGISYSQASGNVQTQIEGTLTKRLQPGLSAMKGVLAALLAQKGFTGPRQSLEGKYGFYNVYHRGNYDSGKLTEGLGHRSEILNLGFKPYPCCRYTHTGIDAILGAKHKYGIDPNDVEYIDVGVSKSGYSAVCEPSERKYDPSTVVDAQFSLPYTVACALVEGKVTIEDFTNEAIKRRNILEVAAKVRPHVDDQLERIAGRGISPAIMKVKMKNGRTHEVFVEVPKGFPNNPLTEEEVLEKFRLCTGHAVRPLPTERMGEIVRIVGKLEEVKNINELAELLF